MKKLSNGTILLYFLKTQLKYIGFFLLFVGLCLFTAVLSAIPLHPILYAFLLCSFLGFLFLIWEFIKYRSNYFSLYQTYTELDTSLTSLPIFSSLLEETYTFLLQELFDAKTSLYTKMRRQSTENSDYYSLWIHQIKTPIAAMHLLLQAEPANRNPLLMEQELFKIEQYAEMALHYLKLQDMSSDLLLKECGLYELVTQSVKKYSVSFIEKKLFLHMEDFSTSVISDEKWIAFVIEQILSNCVKYTNTGGITILCKQASDIVLTISDTGIGIKAEDLPRIFEKGFTGFNGRMNQKSTGIGLYLCKQVVDKLGCTLKVESSLGHGTTFSLIFRNENPILH